MTEISVNLMCISIRSGVQIWVEQSRAATLQCILSTLTQHKFVEFEGQTFNTADLVGVFTPESMDELTRRKNGQWQCKHGEWHGRGEDCECGRENRTAWPASAPTTPGQVLQNRKGLKKVREELQKKGVLPDGDTE